MIIIKLSQHYNTASKQKTKIPAQFRVCRKRMHEAAKRRNVDNEQGKASGSRFSAVPQKAGDAHNPLLPSWWRRIDTALRRPNCRAFESFTGSGNVLYSRRGILLRRRGRESLRRERREKRDGSRKKAGIRGKAELRGKTMPLHRRALKKQAVRICGRPIPQTL